jgi:hypothetical protein
MDDNLKYEEIKPLPRQGLEAAFCSHDEDAICNAMYSAAQHEPDWRWAQGKFLEFLNHKSLLIRSTALNAIGELVLFRGQIDVELVLPAIHQLANDPDLAPFVEQCLEDIRTRITVN